MILASGGDPAQGLLTAEQLSQCLGRARMGLLEQVAEVARGLSVSLYLVGGSVRDLLLSRLHVDLDLVVEGDALLAARRLSEAAGGQAQTHPRFGTATFRHGNLTLDMVSARAEAYPRPGALPVVRPGTIADDLARRDFTVNAIALRLDDGSFSWLDPHGGIEDMGQCLLRVLHRRSFIDDATRILRGARYEARLSFHLETDTEALARRDVPHLDTISGDRLRHELHLILGEQRPEAILKRLDALGALKRLHPSLHADSWLEERFAQARQRSTLAAPNPIPYLGLLTFRLTPDEANSFIQRLNLPRREADLVREAQRLKQDIAFLAQGAVRSSALARRLERLSPGAILATALACGDTSTQESLFDYLARLRYVKRTLSGDDLLKMGFPEGPRVGATLRALQEARWDGLVGSRDDEEAMARNANLRDASGPG